jgi:hypothetical protein
MSILNESKVTGDNMFVVGITEVGGVTVACGILPGGQVEGTNCVFVIENLASNCGRTFKQHCWRIIVFEESWNRFDDVRIV